MPLIRPTPLQEQRLRDTKKLYETAAKDFEYLLGQDALGILQRLEAGYAPVHDHHKMLAKYNARDRTDPPPAPYPLAAEGAAPHLGGPGSAAGRAWARLGGPALGGSSTEGPWRGGSRAGT